MSVYDLAGLAMVCVTALILGSMFVGPPTPEKKDEDTPTS